MLLCVFCGLLPFLISSTYILMNIHYPFFLIFRRKIKTTIKITRYWVAPAAVHCIYSTVSWDSIYSTQLCRPLLSNFLFSTVLTSSLVSLCGHKRIETMNTEDCLVVHRCCDVKSCFVPPLCWVKLPWPWQQSHTVPLQYWVTSPSLPFLYKIIIKDAKNASICWDDSVLKIHWQTALSSNTIQILYIYTVGANCKVWSTEYSTENCTDGAVAAVAACRAGEPAARPGGEPAVRPPAVAQHLPQHRREQGRSSIVSCFNRTESS